MNNPLSALRRLQNRIRQSETLKYYYGGSVISFAKQTTRFTEYLYAYRHEKLRPKEVLLISKNGSDLADNLLHLLIALKDERYASFALYLGADRRILERVRGILEQNALNARVTLLRLNGTRFMRVLARAGTIILDSTLPHYYLKKPGQRILNTWHGTPLKCMGMDSPGSVFSNGNVQRSLLMSDYLLFPNAEMEQLMAQAYGLNELYTGAILRAGYPRNETFFDPEAGRRLRAQFSRDAKKCYLYMPTFRGELGDASSRNRSERTEENLRALDAELADDELLIVKLHLFSQSAIDFSQLKHIIPYPAGQSVYALLNACDGLVTDYSSVMFDFACARKPILLWVYDLEAYESTRGLYHSVNDLPLPKARTAAQLAGLIHNVPDYDREGFAQTYCPWDGAQASALLLRHVLLNESCLTEVHCRGNGRENILIYGSSLAKNGITTALLSLLGSAELRKRNYFVCTQEHVMASDPLRFSILPEGVMTFPISGHPWMSWREWIERALFVRGGKPEGRRARRVEAIYSREWQRCYGMVDFSCAVQFSGYTTEAQLLLGSAPCRRVIFVHNDMEKDIAAHRDRSVAAFRWAYRHYDAVAIVTEALRASTARLGGADAKICVVENLHNAADIRRRALLPPAFDPDTASNMPMETLTALLNTASPRFITIGRFSPEKDHLKLIEAFGRFLKEQPDAMLTIVGGYGPLYEQTLQAAARISPEGRIAVIRSMRNPMPLLKRCDLFVLSSDYEGKPMTLYEADALGLPALSTDIPGPRELMTAHPGGLLVENSADGLLEGMRAYLRGEIKPMKIDFDADNRRAIEQFENLLTGRELDRS